MINKEQVENKLTKWIDCASVEELNSKWINAKKYIARNSESIEERFKLDKMIETYYAYANKLIEDSN